MLEMKFLKMWLINIEDNVDATENDHLNYIVTENVDFVDDIEDVIYKPMLLGSFLT